MSITASLSGVSAAAVLGGAPRRRRPRPRMVRPLPSRVLYAPGIGLGFIGATTGGTVGCLSPPS
jgi:hypothetical protein